MVLHGQVVAVEVRLALCAVDDEGIDFAKAAADLERGREHGTAVTDDTGLADAVKDGFGILHLLGRQGREIRAGGVLEVIFDHDRGDHIAQGWGLGSMAITLPETVAWMGAETGAGLSAIF